jgi:hypothetical protein
MKKGNKMKAKETAVVLIEFQNEFCKEGGKLYDGVKGEIARQNTIPNAAKLAEAAREKGAGAKIFPLLGQTLSVDQFLEQLEE